MEGHTPRCAREYTALTTKPPGGGEEAHRRWPEGRSERGASKAKQRPPSRNIMFDFIPKKFSNLGLTIVRLVREYASIHSNTSALTASGTLFFAAIADIRRFCSTLAELLLERIQALCQMNSQAHFSAAKINPNQMSSTILPSLLRMVPACRQAESKSTLALSAYMKLLKIFPIAVLGTAFTISASFAETTRPNCFLIQSIQAGFTTEIDDLKITNLDNGIVVYENNFESASDATRGLNSYYRPQGGKDTDNFFLNGSKTRVEDGKFFLETTVFNQNGYSGYESHSEMEPTANLPTNFRVEFTARKLHGVTGTGLYAEQGATDELIAIIRSANSTTLNAANTVNTALFV